MSFPSLLAILFAGGALRRRRAFPCWLPSLAFLVAGLLGGGITQAAVYTFNGNEVGSCPMSGTEYTCPNSPFVNWDDAVVIGSGYTLRISNHLTITYNQGLTMQAGAKLIVTGNLNIRGVNPANLRVAGGSIEAGGSFSMGDQAQTLTADVSANTMDLGTNRVTVNGNLVSKSSIAIGSYATINGNLSGTVITTASPVTIAGNVSAGTSFSLASGGKVTGKVDTGSLVLESSEAKIEGSAWVNTARLEHHGRVTGTIYCKDGTAKNKCDCVTNNSGYPVNSDNGPRCEAPAPRAPHHFLLTHDGEGDTCLPEKITVTACANASCSAPHHAGAVSGQLAPFGAAFAIGENTGSVIVSATRFAEGSVTLDVNKASVAPEAATACYRADNTNSCAMHFAGGAKLLVSVSDHAAGADNITATLQALKANDTKNACTAAVESATYDVQYSCNYSKPKTGTLPLVLDAGPLSCAAAGATGATRSIKTSFGADGKARLSLRYADAGEVRLNASLDTQKGMTASGQGSFVTAPASFLVAAQAGTIRAGADFALTITARNAAGATTPNFDTSDLLAAGAVNYAVALGVECHAQGGSKGTVVPASPGFTDGVASFMATWSDVGNIDLNASLAGFLGAGPGTAGSTNTAGSGQCAGRVGPFIPAYFRTELADTRTFRYSGEPFPLLVSAMNQAGGLTVNYTSGLGLSEAVTLAANDRNGSAFTQPPGALANAAIAAAAFTHGVATARPAYTFTLFPTAPTRIRLRATNGKTGELNVVSTAPASAEEAAMPLIRTGRLRLGSRFGGLRTTLSIPVTAEYWTGRSWLLNSDDNDTLIPQDAFAIKPTVSGMTVERTFAASPLRLSRGAAGFDLRVTAGGPGPIDLAVNLGSSLRDNTCIGTTVGTGLATKGAAIPWLRPFTTGCNTAQPRDPSARATFGVHAPENRRVIHVREVFN